MEVDINNGILEWMSDQWLKLSEMYHCTKYITVSIKFEERSDCSYLYFDIVVENQHKTKLHHTDFRFTLPQWYYCSHTHLHLFSGDLSGKTVIELKTHYNTFCKFVQKPKFEQNVKFKIQSWDEWYNKFYQSYEEIAKIKKNINL